MTSTCGRRLLASASALALVLLASTACTKAKTPAEQIAAQAYLEAVGRADVAAAAQRTTEETAATATLTASLAGLGPGATGSLSVTGLANRTDSAATANYSAAWKLPGAASPWRYTGTLPVVKRDGQWRVAWSPADIYPTLGPGQHLAVKRGQPARAALQDSAGRPLFVPTPVVRVGIDKSLVKNLASLSATLAAIPAVQSTAAEIAANVTVAAAGQFVPVITLRKAAYEPIRAQIHDLQGTVFEEATQLLPPTTTFGEPLLGRIGDATADLIKATSGRLRSGDQTGLSGLQLAFDKQLAGVTGVDVYAVRDTDGTPAGRLGAVVAAKAGAPVRLTLDRTVQSAAEAALATTKLPAALVALQPSTGKVLAVANSAAAPGNIAFVGQYPAGSTFKIVTYAAAFASQLSLEPTSAAACPPTVTVDGRSFENQDKFSYGQITLRDAFAYSCNTTAIALALKSPADAMVKAAANLGLGADWSLPVDAFSGSPPAPSSQTERAADAIGQGKVLVSPLLMAAIAGSAAAGTAVAPSLVLGKQAKPGARLATALTAKMSVLMRATVEETGGTAHALADLPGAVLGKTGTAEFGTDVPPRSHSWFAGGRGDLAFAVFVYGGESSHTAAVPIAHAFLSDVP